MNGIRGNKKTYGSNKRNNGGKNKKDEEPELSNDQGSGEASRRALSKRDLKKRLEERKRQKDEVCL